MIKKHFKSKTFRTPRKTHSTSHSVSVSPTHNIIRNLLDPSCFVSRFTVMMAFFWRRLSCGDATGFKFLFSIAFLYTLMAAIAYCVLHMKHISPLPLDAPLDRFSEARAVQHIRVLAEEIDGRQVIRRRFRLSPLTTPFFSKF